MATIQTPFEAMIYVLPPVGSVWPLNKQQEWLEAMTLLFRLLYRAEHRVAGEFVSGVAVVKLSEPLRASVEVLHVP